MNPFKNIIFYLLWMWGIPIGAVTVWWVLQGRVMEAMALFLISCISFGGAWAIACMRGNNDESI